MKKENKEAMLVSASAVLGKEIAQAYTDDVAEIVSAETEETSLVEPAVMSDENMGNNIVVDDVADVYGPVPEVLVENIEEIPITEINLLAEDDIDVVPPVYGPPPGYIEDFSGEIDDTMCVYGPPPEIV